MSRKKEKLTKAILTEDEQVLTRRPDGTYEQATGKTDWARLAAMKDEDIDYSDIPELTETFWKEAKVVLPESKRPVFLRLDSDVLQWFRQQGRGYQTRINAILRAYMKAHEHGGSGHGNAAP
jgi:uncharacterized protein (DUF4415 family)